MGREQNISPFYTHSLLRHSLIMHIEAYCALFLHRISLRVLRIVPFRY